MLVRQALRCAAFSACVIGVLTTTNEAVADEPAPIVQFNPDAAPPPATQGTILLAGAAVTGVFYGAAAGASAIWSDDPGASDLVYPLVGPWMKLGQTQLCNEDSGLDCNNGFQVAGAILLVFDGIGQAGGVALLVEGLLYGVGRPDAVRGGSSAPRVSSVFAPSRAFAAPWDFRLGGLHISPVPFLPRVTTLESKSPGTSAGSRSFAPIPALDDSARTDFGFGFVGTF